MIGRALAHVHPRGSVGPGPPVGIPLVPEQRSLDVVGIWRGVHTGSTTWGMRAEKAGRGSGELDSVSLLKTQKTQGWRLSLHPGLAQ